MDHELPLITTIALGFTAAWLLGLLTQRFGLSPIVGYLLAGVAIGPYTPGLAGDVNIAQQLAEVGVILLMFGVGLHFHLNDLLAVKSVAIPGAIGQSLVATVASMCMFHAFGMSWTTGAVIGMAMSVASTVVLMRVLMDADALNSSAGHIAVGWLLVEDIFTVVVLVLIPVLGGNGTTAVDTPTLGLGSQLAIALAKLGVLVVILLVVGARVIPWVLVQVARLRSRELFTLTVLVFSVAMAAASYRLFGASMALGAFLAGMVVAQSPVSAQVGADALPMRDAFAVLFFVSVGMLFNPAFVWQEPLLIAAALGIILLVKPLAALLIVALLGRSAHTALTVAIGLAQIGEFSFILSDLARNHGLMRPEGHNVIVAAAIISITLNPMLFRALPSMEAFVRRRPRWWALLNGRAERRTRKFNQDFETKIERHRDQVQQLAIVVGFGPVGRSVHRLLSDAGLATVVIETNMDTISELTSQGQLAVFGDATHEAVLEQAGVVKASHLVLTMPHSAARVAVVTAARNLNSKVKVFVRAHYLRERGDLEKAGATAAVFEEAEAAIALARLVMSDSGATRDDVERKLRDLRLQLILENMSSIRSQRVRSIMVPWSRVRRLTTIVSRAEVMHQIAQHRFSRWPVVDPHTGRVLGYLLTKDLIADADSAEEWTRLVRAMRPVAPNDDVESTLLDMQQEGATIRLVEDSGIPVGMVTLEDILEQVVGRIEDEYPHQALVSLREALDAGGVLLDLSGATREEVIKELAAAIPANRLPPDSMVAELAIARELEISSDLGCGVAFPHTRCPHLTAPVVAFGRSPLGVPFSINCTAPVRLVFLLVTSEEHLDVHLSLLAQLARIAQNESMRAQLLEATSERDVLEIVAAVKP
ncbi:MAG: cation:proton antiporter [Pirellulales bacterium]|nr:cation:proton antiporter [Pirellulales bacterium]